MCLKQKQIKQLYKFLKINKLEHCFLEEFNNIHQIQWRYNRGKPQDISKYISLFCEKEKGLAPQSLGLFYNNFFLEAFIWRETKQGHQFWMDIHYKFLNEVYD